MSEVEIKFSWRWRWWARPLLWAWIACARLGLGRRPTRRELARLIIVSFALLVLGCRDASAPPNPDASDAQAIGDALPDGGIAAAVCANLRQNQCEEGLDPKCEATINHDIASPVTTMPLTCWASASGKPALRACGDSRSGHLACP